MDAVIEAGGKKVVQPVLIVSEHTIEEYSILLEHLLMGLAGESVCAGLICRPKCDVDSVLSPMVDVFRYPVFDVPFMGRLNRRLLFERLERFKPSVLHCLCESKAGFTRQLARQMNIPYVISVNSLHKRWGMLSLSTQRCARILVPAGTIATNLQNLYPRFLGRIKQVNPGTFATDASECFLDPGRLASMVMAYPMNKAEHFEKLFRAVRHLVIDGNEFMFVITGSGSQERQLRKLVNGLGLMDVVVIVPRLAAWRSILAAGDIFVRPQSSDSFDPTLLEAMSVGAAVAACKGGVDDLIMDGQTAVVFDPNDELSIYNILQRLLNQRDYARQVALQAQQYLRENHSVSKMIADILQVYYDAQRWYLSDAAVTVPGGSGPTS